MIESDVTSELTAEERLAEIASILAAGILRLHKRFALPTEKGQIIAPESLPEGLEVPGETRLSVCAG
jgi:hypothetical protein